MADPTFFINQSSTIGVMMKAMTENSTGSDFLSYLIIAVIGLVILGMMFRLPIELIGLFIVPILLVMSSFIGDFTGVLGFVLIYLTFVLAKHFIFVK
jgi:hypothetical protein